MKRALLVLPEARGDVADAIEWLGERSPDLPGRFRSALDDAFRRMSEQPDLFPFVHRDLRRALLRHFPYSVYFLEHEGAVVVFGVIHQARHPSVWKRRSPN